AEQVSLLTWDGHRGEPDALTAHVRFWEGAKLNRLSRCFMLNLKARYSPRVAGRPFFQSKHHLSRPR
ncbi:MAG: hypothetical protein ACK52L_09155, partial [Pirellula sp.]